MGKYILKIHLSNWDLYYMITKGITQPQSQIYALEKEITNSRDHVFVALIWNLNLLYYWVKFHNPVWKYVVPYICWQLNSCVSDCISLQNIIFQTENYNSLLEIFSLNLSGNTWMENCLRCMYILHICAASLASLH